MTVFAALVDPMASVLHGVAHAAESAHDREHVANPDAGHGVARAHSHRRAGVEIEAPEHDSAHEALHRAALRDASTPYGWDAAPSAPTPRVTAPLLTIARGSRTHSDGTPPDFGLGSRELARAPPLS